MLDYFNIPKSQSQLKYLPVEMFVYYNSIDIICGAIINKTITIAII